MTTPLPSAHEPLPADFLRKYGAQKGMRYRQKGNAEDAWDLWPDWGDKFPAETCYNLYDFCAPAGTIAAATTPLPERECDCGAMEARGDIFYNCVPSCSIHRPYHHILPAALAALPEKPDGLICCRSLEKLPSAKWGDFVYWPIVPDGETPNGFPFADFAYAVPAQSGQGQGKEYRVTCPHCLGQQKANGAVCLECNGIGYWMNPYPLSTQPEGGEECAPQQMPATSVAVGHTAEEQVSARSTPSPSSASNAAPANVPTVAGSGQREGERDRIPCPECNGTGSIGKVWYYIDRKTGEITYPPSPPSTAGETAISDAAAYWPGCSQCTDAGILVVPLETARDLERQLAAAEAWKDEISAAIQRSGLGIMRTSQGPVGTIICTRPEVKDAEDRKVLELIRENIDLETRLTTVTAERDEAMKRLETIQTT